MGTFTIKVHFYNPKEPERSINVEALVDTGATMSGLSTSNLKDLGVEPEWTVPSRLADGRVVERPCGIAGVEIEGRKSLVPVAFKEEASPAVIGATTLELLAFTVDPVERRLVHKPILE